MDRADQMAARRASTPRASFRRACCACPIASTLTRCRKADLVVSAGGETQMPNICVSRFLGGVPSIFCGSLLRGLGPENFSLIISSYDRDAASPRHMVVLKPSVDRSRRARPAGARAALRARTASEARRAPDRRQCRAVPLPSRGMGATARLHRRGFARMGHALARVDLAPHARRSRRPYRRARQGRKRGRPLHRLPHCRARHAARDVQHGRSDRLHRGFEHHDLGSRFGAAAGGRRGAGRPSLHRRGADLPRASSSTMAGAGCCRSPR